MTPDVSWRGPFRVVRSKPRGWRIVDAAGNVERLGYTDKHAADTACRLQNESRIHDGQTARFEGSTDCDRQV